MENKKLTIIALLGLSILATTNIFAASQVETAPENNTPENHTLALPAELPVCGLTQYQYEAAKQAEEVLKLQREDIEKMEFFNRVKLAGILEECAPKTHPDYFAKNKNAIAIRVQELIRMKSPKVAQIHSELKQYIIRKEAAKFKDFLLQHRDAIREMILLTLIANLVGR